jgi:hypothetical protein
MTTYENVKNVVEGAVSASVGLVIHTVIAKNTPVGLRFLPRIGMRFGTLVIGTILSNMAAKRITDNLDEIFFGVRDGIEEAEAELKAKDALISETAEVITPKPKRKPAAKTTPKDEV